MILSKISKIKFKKINYSKTLLSNLKYYNLKGEPQHPSAHGVLGSYRKFSSQEIQKGSNELDVKMLRPLMITSAPFL